MSDKPRKRRRGEPGHDDYDHEYGDNVEETERYGGRSRRPPAQRAAQRTNTHEVEDEDLPPWRVDHRGLVRWRETGFVICRVRLEGDLVFIDRWKRDMRGDRLQVDRVLTLERLRELVDEHVATYNRDRRTRS